MQETEFPTWPTQGNTSSYNAISLFWLDCMQGNQYLRLASMHNQADVVEYLLGLGLDATETVLVSIANENIQ